MSLNAYSKGVNQTLRGFSGLTQRNIEQGLVAESLVLGFGGTSGLPGRSLPEEGLAVPLFPAFHEALSILPVNLHFYLGSLHLVSVTCKWKQSAVEETSVQNNGVTEGRGGMQEGK